MFILKRLCAVTALLGLVACGDTDQPPREPGFGTLGLSYGKRGECTLTGPGIEIKKRTKVIFYGKGFVAEGPMLTSTIECTLANGTKLISTSHRAEFIRSGWVHGSILGIRPGKNRWTGVLSLNRTQYEFAGELVFTRP